MDQSVPPLENPAYFHVAFRPNLRLVSTVRRFTDEFYRRVLVDQEVSSRLALATHELLENAVAYAVDGETGVRIDLADDNLTIKTWNRTSADRVESVRAAIDEMNRAPDADEYYQLMLLKTAKRTDGSGLGLARIRAEADMSVSYEIEDDRVCIVAKTKTPMPALQPGTGFPGAAP
ncbi:MAG TPA: ATP-binding protein [Kofleriaceae bacterium]|jgi:anti-sigma regulatory factor (Ser/Thr protein kinase)